MKNFETIFGLPAQVSAQAPGRVNLMGEHTDYNQGFVLPTILPLKTIVQIGVDNSVGGKIDIFSANYQQRIERSLHKGGSNHWSEYIVACLQQLQQYQIIIPSLKILVESNVPIGAGVASSAALEIAFLKAVRKLLQLNLTDLEIASLAQKAESEGVGMPCGIMDQMVTSLGRENQALFLDTKDLSFEYVKLPTNYDFAVIHSGKTHVLAKSAYKQRRQECEKAAALMNVSSLRDVCLPELNFLDKLPHTLRQRVVHVVTENQRVLDSVAAIEENRLADLGELMNASHLSQKNQFEVTIKETDLLCKAAIERGAIGARQTGGGFGGAIVALVPRHAVQSWWNFVCRDCPQASFICTSQKPQKALLRRVR
ncbi:MAG: galactokinase [Prochloraceae cyanobacterium]|nr:galactokinase [Prochloraceae cyanobacterium]